jgi:protein tyrosine/serine phosphatase
VSVQARSLQTYAVSTLIALSLTVPAAAQIGGGNPLPNIRIGNFGQVSGTYYRGAQPTGRDYTDLAALGVKTVIDLQEDGLAVESGLVQKAGMKFFRIPMTTHVPPTTAQLEQFLTLVNDPANQPVFVHCAGGRHRTGIMTAVYRMTDAGWTSDQAFKEMKRYNFGPDFLHPEFKRFVFTYRAQPKPTLTPNIVAVTVAGQ